ncbi:MAG: universal stress protein UspA [Planctomycetes bacterium]|nr:universal stress protein UspA [Planctomycetota bacterium]
MKFSHILLTTDLSDESLRAFAPAADLARESGAKLTLLHVVQDVQVAPHGAPLAPPVSAPDVGNLVDAARHRLDEQKALLGSGLNVECAVTASPDIAERVASYAKEHGCDLIALSTHGRSGFRRFVLGSVAEAILRHAHVPVMCFPRPE